MAFDLSKLQASSLTPGITTVGEPLSFSTTFSGTIPINGSLTTTLNLVLPGVDLMANIRVNVTGGNIGALWFPITGATVITGEKNSIGSGYSMLFTVTASSSGRVLNIAFLNRTAAATVTLPTLTINAVVQPYTFPF